MFVSTNARWPYNGRRRGPEKGRKVLKREGRQEQRRSTWSAVVMQESSSEERVVGDDTLEAMMQKHMLTQTQA